MVMMNDLASLFMCLKDPELDPSFPEDTDADKFFELMMSLVPSKISSYDELIEVIDKKYEIIEYM